MSLTTHATLALMAVWTLIGAPAPLKAADDCVCKVEGKAIKYDCGEYNDCYWTCQRTFGEREQRPPCDDECGKCGSRDIQKGVVKDMSTGSQGKSPNQNQNNIKK